MTRYHATVKGNRAFTPEEEAQADADEAESESRKIIEANNEINRAVNAELIDLYHSAIPYLVDYIAAQATAPQALKDKAAEIAAKQAEVK